MLLLLGGVLGIFLRPSTADKPHASVRTPPDVRGKVVRSLHSLRVRNSLFLADGQPSLAEMCEIAGQYTVTPSLCMLGHDRFSPAALQASVPAFAQTLAAMRATFPGPQCCMGVNHLFAVYAAVQAVQPLAVIESGVAAGHTTWLLRHMLPSAPIFSLDPVDAVLSYPAAGGIVGYADPSPLSARMVGPAFVDLAQARWDVLIPDPAVRARTFVLLDDHQSTIERIKMLRRWGFKYIFYEDNYPFKVATSRDEVTCPQLAGPRPYASRMHGDAYSPNTMCAPVPDGTVNVLYKDRFGKVCRDISMQEHVANVAYFQSVLASYYEFPALFSRCPSTRAPLLTEAQLAPLALPVPELEIWQYGHLHPPLMELKPVEPAAVAGELAAAVAAAAKFALDVANGQQIV